MADEADVDRELLARVRAGDDAAFGELYTRHADAVRRFALRHVREHAEADDLAAEAFFRVLQAIRRGSGPTEHVRTYLLTTARRVAWEWSGRRRDVPVEDEELSRRVEPFPDATAGRAEHTLISRAFTSLPERWRSVLWQVEVEGVRPSAVAPAFGLSPNAMAALARRAREGLRAAYLQAHLADDRGPRACHSVVVKLGSYTAGGVQGAEQARIRKHLRTCSSCNALHAELAEVCSTLRAHAGLLAAPALLSLAFAPQLAAPVAGKVKLALTAASVAAVGVFGVVAGALDGGPGPALVQPGPHALRTTVGDALTPLPSVTLTGTATSVPPTGEGSARPAVVDRRAGGKQGALTGGDRVGPPSGAPATSGPSTGAPPSGGRSSGEPASREPGSGQAEPPTTTSSDPGALEEPGTTALSTPDDPEQPGKEDPEPPTTTTTGQEPEPEPGPSVLQSPEQGVTPTTITLHPRTAYPVG
ncbi:MULTISPECIES: sigma-70 family RNA polymerase sigma factor [Actinosynnema]|uniref:sigma-70 family RNA polymerase sigma factor n=1 Tax=Actinosynnema TaxID=40566 RepID=UPI0020A46D3F|nr:sigma-70 family RNA polymerase sigma factor [Actinosynnema pretiosum]MCP2093442.1 RNA polymerase sigma factor, sigma-70 family [Actinosynnema pretiosum]